ncbi:MAG: phenylalanine--tRNA ligase subunit beta [bacterium]
MKISRSWLQKYFEAPLPSTAEIAEAFTFHAFEIEEANGDLLDVKVLPNRAADCLSHRGLAKELSAILNLSLKSDPLREPLPLWPGTDTLKITIDDPKKSARQMGALVRGVKVGPSPVWLREALEAVGQRSINNIVDATNYVTLDMGQPLHAFDAKKIEWHDGTLSIRIRGTAAGENITVLTGEDYVLPENTTVIAEGTAGTVLDIAGIKGGMASAISEDTTDLYVSVAHFDPVSVRKTAQALKLFTDASARFQNNPSPELAAYGMRAVLDLIEQVAGGELVGVVDIYPNPQTQLPVQVSLARINGRLGSSFTLAEVKNAFDRLGLACIEAGEMLTVTPPFERRDLLLPEDLAEEAGQVLGYDRVPAVELPALPGAPDQARFRGISRIKDILAEHGYTEISTQSFTPTGDVYLANPLDTTKPVLRPGLIENMQDALKRAAVAAPRVLGPADKLKLFEIGAVFTKDTEHLSLALGYAQLSGKKSDAVLPGALDALGELLGAIPESAVKREDGAIEVDLSGFDLAALGKDYAPRPVGLGTYRPFSIYPFALRDIAVWTPLGTEQDEVEQAIFKEAGSELARLDLFDRFEKDGKLSYAFRLVFEAFDRTLTDVELVEAMDRVSKALNAKEGFSVR